MGLCLSAKLVALLAQRPIALSQRRLECLHVLTQVLIDRGSNRRVSAWAASRASLRSTSCWTCRSSSPRAELSSASRRSRSAARFARAAWSPRNSRLWSSRRSTWARGDSRSCARRSHITRCDRAEVSANLVQLVCATVDLSFELIAPGVESIVFGLEPGRASFEVGRARQEFSMLLKESFMLFFQTVFALYRERFDPRGRRSLWVRRSRFCHRILVCSELEELLALLAPDLFAEIHPADTQSRLAMRTNRDDSIGTTRGLNRNGCHLFARARGDRLVHRIDSLLLVGKAQWTGPGCLGHGREVRRTCSRCDLVVMCALPDRFFHYSDWFSSGRVKKRIQVGVSRDRLGAAAHQRLIPGRSPGPGRPSSRVRSAVRKRGHEWNHAAASSLGATLGSPPFLRASHSSHV